MGLSKATKCSIVLGTLFAAYVCYVLVMMNDHALAWWNFAYGILFSVCVICAFGLWDERLWAWWLSLVLATAGLGLGLYFTHFAWTFWIFKQPTLLERLMAALHPRIFVFMFVPAAWLFYFTKRQIRVSFRM